MRVFSPYVELLWKCLPATLEEIKDSGFDGVECHLIGRLRKSTRVIEIKKEVAQLGLDIRFHQGWSWETGQRSLYNVVLRSIQALVPVGLPLVDQVHDVMNTAVVIYGNLASCQQNKPNYAYQTMSECIKCRAYSMPFTNFEKVVKKSNLPVVFDNQHILEWYMNKESVAGLPTVPATLEQMINHLWKEFCPFVKEIHLCDFNPSLGSLHGRNVFLGEGIFPLENFCANVRASGWNGIVTPEVAFEHIRGKDKLQMLLKKVNELFDL